MIISLIAALTKNHVIGKNKDLPWHLPDDMKHFMQTTQAHHVIMGRKNYESIPDKFRPLPNRINIVVTRQKDFSAPGCHIVNSIEEGIAMARTAREKELFIIGGSEIYSQSIPYADQLYLTEIDTILEGDTYFPSFNRDEWQELSRTHHEADARHLYAFDFVIYKKK